jgi:hypothetical protein
MIIIYTKVPPTALPGGATGVQKLSGIHCLQTSLIK